MIARLTHTGLGGTDEEGQGAEQLKKMDTLIGLAFFLTLSWEEDVD